MDINRKFGFVTGGACLVICIFKLVFHRPHLMYFAVPGGFLLLAAIVIPVILNPLRIAWDKLGSVLGIINSYVILTIVFFVIITPIAFILRLMKKNLLDLRPAKNKPGTYWQTVTIAENRSLKQQF